MKTIKAPLYYVLEYLPWLPTPRVVDEKKTEEEAKIEAQRLNSLAIPESTFTFAKGYVFMDINE